jgi:transcriptional regulator with XRE-family HTH domain
MVRWRTPRRPGRPKIESPNPIDIRIGVRLRLRRNMLGLSQEKLGEAIGLTFQQVQKYEQGANRIGASRLHELSQGLDVPISFFFDDTDSVRAPAMGGFTKFPAEDFESDPARKPEMLELIQAYLTIEDSTVRRRLLDFVKALTVEATPPPENSLRQRQRLVGFESSCPDLLAWNCQRSNAGELRLCPILS